MSPARAVPVKTSKGAGKRCTNDQVVASTRYPFTWRVVAHAARKGSIENWELRARRSKEMVNLGGIERPSCGSLHPKSRHRPRRLHFLQRELETVARRQPAMTTTSILSELDVLRSFYENGTSRSERLTMASFAICRFRRLMWGDPPTFMKRCLAGESSARIQAARRRD